MENRCAHRSTRYQSLIAGRARPRTELIVKNHLTRHGAVCVAGWNKLPSSRCEHRESGEIAVCFRHLREHFRVVDLARRIDVNLDVDVDGSRNVAMRRTGKARVAEWGRGDVIRTWVALPNQRNAPA